MANTTPQTATITQEQRLKIETSVEREIHKFVDRISELSYDDTHLYLRRNPNNTVPFETADEVLKVAKLSLHNAQIRMMDDFMRRVQAALDECLPPVKK